MILEYVNYIGLFSIILLLIIIILLIWKKIKFQQKYKEEYIEQKKQQFVTAYAKEQEAYEQLRLARQSLEQSNQQRIKDLNQLMSTQEAAAKKAIEAIEAKKVAYQKSQDEYIEQTNFATDLKLKGHFSSEKNIYESELQSVVEELREAAYDEYEALVSSLTQQLGALQSEVNEYRLKRDAINAEILRQRALDEKQDFYRVVLDQSSIEDINVLNSIRKNLHKHDSLDKLIYDTYISKPVQEMVKRVLEGRAPSGIYKITRLRTGEIYIGKSTDVKTRWIQHAKTAFGCGTIARSVLHTTIARDGLENFTFELLEEVPKDKLTEREHYYIEFYDAKRYGLNEREG